MDDQSTQAAPAATPDEQPVAEQQAPPTTQDEQPIAETPESVEVEQPNVQTAQETSESPVEQSVEEDDDDLYQYQQVQEVPQLDLNNLSAGEDGLIDPNELAGAINQQMQSAVEAAKQAARNEYLEQRAEEKQWEKAYTKYPELKNNKELRDLVHRARLGEVTDLLSRSQDPSSVKLPTPGQVADRFFNHIGTAKAEGMKQATQNTVIQASAHVETSSRKTNDSAEAQNKLYQNINNPDKTVAKQARTDLLKQLLFGEK